MKKEGQREEWYLPTGQAGVRACLPEPQWRQDASGNIMSIYHRDISANSLAQIELPIYGSGKIGNAFRQPDHLNYNYELTDHLGNVRATVSNVHTLAVATMEPDNDAWESQYFDNLSTRHSDPLMAYQSYYSSRLNFQQPVGPTLITEVKEGATVNLSAWTKYQSPSPEDNLGAAAGDIYGLLQSALESATTGETALMSPEVPGGLLSGLMNLLNTGTFDPNSPRAYLQYILFDENWGYVTSDEIQVPSAAEGSYAELKLEDIPVGSDGYLYVYVVNESEIDVHFDNLTVGVLGLNVLSTRNYYPYGSVAQECLPAGQAGKNPDFDDRYRFGYQGQFAEEDTVTGWNHFELREYDGKIGRWLVVDPYRQFSNGYLGMGNNPLNMFDPDGGWNWHRNKETGAIVYNEGTANIDGHINLGATFEGYLSDGTFFYGHEDGSSTRILNTITITAQRDFVAEAVRKGQRDFVLASLDIARYSFGRVGAGATAAGLIISPFVPPVGGALVVTGMSLSTISGMSSVSLNIMKENYGSAAIDAAFLGVGSSSNALINNVNKEVISETGKTILNSAIQTHIEIHNNITRPAINEKLNEDD